jgi:hypothetical protein
MVDERNGYTVEVTLPAYRIAPMPIWCETMREALACASESPDAVAVHITPAVLRPSNA